MKLMQNSDEKLKKKESEIKKLKKIIKEYENNLCN